MPLSPEAQAHLSEWDPVVARSQGRVVIPPLGWSLEYRRDWLGHDADILHTHGLWQHPSWGALEWKRRYKRPHVVSVRGMLEPWAWRHMAWKKRPVWWLWERRNLESASLLHATSEQELQSFRERGLTAPIAIIPNGVEVPLAASEGLKVEGRRSGVIRVKTNHDLRTALFLSRLHPKKGLPLLLEAWAKVDAAGWGLRIVGPDEGGHEAELKRLCASLGLSTSAEAPDVIFSGPLTGNAKERAYQDADLFILPTHSENFGIAVAEALAHGVPVITTHGAPWELLVEEGCGWWVPVTVDGIAGALADATKRAPDELAAMGKRGRAVVADRFSYDKIAAEMIACYEWVLGNGPRPGCVFV